MNDKLFSLDGFVLGQRRAPRLATSTKPAVDQALLISRVLRVFGEHDGGELSVMDLAENLQEDFEAVRSVVNALVSDGYVDPVARFPSGNDRVCVVSPKGVEAMRKASKT